MKRYNIGVWLPEPLESLLTNLGVLPQNPALPKLLCLNLPYPSLLCLGLLPPSLPYPN